MENRKEKKKVQVNVDKMLSQKVDDILDSLGLNPSVLINALYKRVAARGEVPFSLTLTNKEKINIDLINAIETIPTKQISSPEELATWLDEDED